MTRMQLVTFLTNDIADSANRTDRLSKYAAPSSGGGDYYWPLRKGAQKMFMEGMGYDQAVSTTMANMTVDHQRNHNQLALKQLHQWKMAKPGDAISPPVGEISAPLGALIVKLEPEFALQYKGKKTAYAAWALKDTRLTSKVAGMGIHLLELGLQKEEFHDWKFCMIDVVTGECFKRCHKGTAQAVEFALRTQEELLISCLKKAS